MKNFNILFILLISFITLLLFINFFEHEIHKKKFIKKYYATFSIHFQLYHDF